MKPSNFTDKATYGLQSMPVRYVWAAYFLFILLSSLVGDTLILIASLKHKAIKLPKVIVVLIEHIAACDLVLAVTFVLPNFVSLVADGWMFSDLLCFIEPYISYYCYYVNLYLVCLMTTSKVYLLKCPFRASIWTGKRTCRVCAGIWGCCLWIPLIFSLVDWDDTAFDYRRYHCDYKFSALIWKWLTPTCCTLMVILPSLIVVAATALLLQEARSIMSRSREKNRESLRSQGVVTVIATAVVYCLSIFPYTVYRVAAPYVADSASAAFHVNLYR